MDDQSTTVLGGRGFIGTHLVRHLRQLGYSCYSPERDDSAIWTQPLGHVVYAAGVTADFRTRPYDTVESHVCLLQRLVQKANFRSLTYLSSTRVYGGCTVTSEATDLRVNPVDSQDLYNISKLMGEAICLHCGRARMKVARLSNVVGVRTDSHSFLGELLEQGCLTGKVTFRGGLECKRDYLFIDDAVDVLTRIALSPGEGIYNVASGECIENGEIARLLTAELGFEISVAANARSSDFPQIDITKTKVAFGFSPRPFIDYFPGFIRAYRNRRGT